VDGVPGYLYDIVNIRGGEVGASELAIFKQLQHVIPRGVRDGASEATVRAARQAAGRTIVAKRFVEAHADDMQHFDSVLRRLPAKAELLQKHRGDVVKVLADPEHYRAAMGLLLEKERNYAAGGNHEIKKNFRGQPQSSRKGRELQAFK
jgi:hypothetical protein